MHEQNRLPFAPPQPEGTPSPAGHCLRRAGCHSLGSRCPTARTGKQRTVHGSIDREVRWVKNEHLVRHCPALANGLPWVYLDKAESFRRKHLLSLLSFPGEAPPVPAVPMGRDLEQHRLAQSWCVQLGDTRVISTLCPGVFAFMSISLETVRYNEI